MGNPFLLASVLDRVDSALGDAIAILEREGAAVSMEGEHDPLLERFLGWRAEIDKMRGVPADTARERSRSGSRPRVQEGGLFQD